MGPAAQDVRAPLLRGRFASARLGTAGACAISGGGPAVFSAPVFQTEDERGHALLGATEELVERGAKRVKRLRGRRRGLAEPAGG
jgi:hypothetical protein